MKKIMIVDDEPDIAETMKMLISGAGYQPVWQMDPRKALDEMKGFDLILLDLMMPKMSGRQVLAEMKKRAIKVPVVVVSAVGVPMEVADELAKAYPGVEFIAKTEMHTDLLTLIKQKLGK